MRKTVIALLTSSAVLAPVASADAANLRQKAAHRYKVVVHKHGKRAAGRPIHKIGVRFLWKSKDGKRRHWGVRPATNHELARFARQLKVLATPPPPLLVRTAVMPRQPPAGAQTASVAAGGTLQAIAQCESGGNPSTNTGNGFYGKYQFTQSTWQSVGGSGNPAAASEAEQDRRAAILYARSGPGQWPVCGR